MRTLADRFWAKVQKTDGCWLWTAVLQQWGYGRFWVKPRQILAHRMSWELSCGPIPKGLCVLHRCDNPKCVRPDHLFLGTNADNTADMMRKRRNYVFEKPVPATHCKNGHEYSASNTAIQRTGRRRCRSCSRAAGKRHQLKLKESGR